MPLRASLLTDLQGALGTFSSLNISAADQPWDVYEAYSFGLVLQAGRRVGASVSFEDVNGSATTSLVFRTSPGTVYPGSKAIPYTHGVLRFPKGVEFEVHQGVYVSGKSGVAHECDVAVVERTEAQTCRSRRVNPRSKCVLLAVECKLYAALGIDLARSFIGLTSDLAPSDRFFISNTSHGNLEMLLTHHGRSWETNVVPFQVQEVNRLRARFETAIKKRLTRP